MTFVGKLNPGRVEIEFDAHGTVLRDNREPHKPLLRFTHAEWLLFLADARRKTAQLSPP